MNFIDDLLEYVKKYLCQINFGRVYLYKLQESITEYEYDYKYLEKRFLIQNISSDNIVNGRLTISIPSNIIGGISEIMVISE